MSAAVVVVPFGGSRGGKGTETVVVTTAAAAAGHVIGGRGDLDCDDGGDHDHNARRQSPRRSGSRRVGVSRGSDGRSGSAQWHWQYSWIADPVDAHE